MNRGRRRSLIWLMPLSLAVFIVVSDLFGWAYLRVPAAALLGAKLQRQVEIGPPLQMHLRKTIPIRVGSLFIAAPDWSEQPHFVDVDRLEADVDWGVLVGRRPLIRRLTVAQADVRAERDRQGRASWSMGDKEGADAAGPVLPVIERVSIGKAAIAIDDAWNELKIQVDAKTREGQTGEGQAAAGQEPGGGLTASGNGNWKGDPLGFELRTAGLLQLLEGGALTGIDLKGHLKSTELAFKGSVSDLTRLRQVSGSVSANGASLGDLTAIPGVTLPTTPSYRLEGTIERDGTSVKVDVSRAEIGSSSMVAQLQYDTSDTPPTLRGSIDASRLVLQDLGPSIGTTGARGAKPPGQDTKHRQPGPGAASRDESRVLPRREFNLPSLRDMNADVALDLQKLELGTEALRPLHSLNAKLVLGGSVLKLQNLRSNLAGGTLTGSTSFDGSALDSAPIFEAMLRWNRVDLKNWINLSGGDYFVAGRFSGETILKGRGRSTADILESLRGTVKGHIDGGSISHQIVEIAGLDAAQALGVFFAGDKPLALTCALVDLTADKGSLRSNLFLLNTTDTVFFVQGGVDFRNETLDLRLVQSPKDWSPLSLRSPITIRGTLGNPAIGVEAAPIALKVVSSVVLAAVTPIAALLPLIDLQDSSAKEGCAPAIEQVKARAAELRSQSAAPAGADEGKPPDGGRDGSRHSHRPGRSPGERR